MPPLAAAPGAKHAAPGIGLSRHSLKNPATNEAGGRAATRQYPPSDFIC